MDTVASPLPMFKTTKPSTPWKSGKPYAKDDVVTLEGASFKSKIDDNLDTPSTSAEDWDVVK